MIYSYAFPFKPLSKLQYGKRTHGQQIDLLTYFYTVLGVLQRNTLCSLSFNVLQKKSARTGLNVSKVRSSRYPIKFII